MIHRSTSPNCILLLYSIQLAGAAQKIPDIFSCNSSKRDLIFVIFFLAKALLRDWAINSCFILPRRPNNVSALPGETQTTENASFQLNAVYRFVRQRTKHVEIIIRSPSNWRTFVKQAIGAPNKIKIIKKRHRTFSYLLCVESAFTKSGVVCLATQHFNNGSFSMTSME